MGPRWKGKGCEAKALADPMSTILSQLQSSLTDSSAHGILSGSTVILAAEQEQTRLLNSTCFGRPIVAAAEETKDKHWFQLSMEEAFYLCHSLKCLNVLGQDNVPQSDQELWQYMTSKKDTFPESYKAYSHLRKKNWVVRSGSQYGADFVAYRHHPSLVHSEYAILVSRANGGGEGRLKVWSDVHGAVRLCGAVAKTLMVLYVDRCGRSSGSPSWRLEEDYLVEERIVERWIPEQCREDDQKRNTAAENGEKSDHLK